MAVCAEHIVLYIVAQKVNVCVLAKQSKEVLEHVRDDQLRRIAPEALLDYYRNGPLRLFDSKGVEYSDVKGRRVRVEYSVEVQDADGFFVNEDRAYHGTVVDFQPIPYGDSFGLLVEFDKQKDDPEDEREATYWVNDGDDWVWGPLPERPELP